MSVTIGEVYRRIDEFAPFALQEEWDNAGMLAGSANQPVEGILCALDLNEGVLREAIEKKAQMIVTHHPILFRGRKNLREDDAEGRLLCRLIRSGVGLIAAHTNFDNAVPGVNDALAAALGLHDVEAHEEGMRIGVTDIATLGEFRSHAENVLGGPIRCYGEDGRKIARVALLGGAGGDFAPQARKLGADVYLTGEIAHHKAWDAYSEGMCVLEAGHAATELPAISMLAGALQIGPDGVKWNVRVHTSEAEMFR